MDEKISETISIKIHNLGFYFIIVRFSTGRGENVLILIVRKNTFFGGCQSWTLTSDIMRIKIELQSRDKK